MLCKIMHIVSVLPNPSDISFRKKTENDDFIWDGNLQTTLFYWDFSEISIPCTSLVSSAPFPTYSLLKLLFDRTLVTHLKLSQEKHLE